MILSQTAEYAIRAAATLACYPGGAASLEISKEADIPQAYLSKILRQLVEAELLSSKTGSGGGFNFTKPLSEIRIIDILTAVNQSPNADHCPFGWTKCSHKNPCPLHDSYSKLKDNYLEWSYDTTIQSVLDNKGKIT